MWGFIPVIVFKVLVLFSSMNVNEFNETIILLHLLKSFLFIPSMFRIPQIINRHGSGIESKTSTQSKNVSVKRNRNCGILKINDRLNAGSNSDSQHQMIQTEPNSFFRLFRFIAGNDMGSSFVAVF